MKILVYGAFKNAEKSENYKEKVKKYLNNNLYASIIDLMVTIINSCAFFGFNKVNESIHDWTKVISTPCWCILSIHLPYKKISVSTS